MHIKDFILICMAMDTTYWTAAYTFIHLSNLLPLNIIALNI